MLRRQCLYGGGRVQRRDVSARRAAKLQRRQLLHRRQLQPHHGVCPHEQHRLVRRRERLHPHDRGRGGVCVGGLAPNCGGGNVCTDDTRSPSTGCVHNANTAPCNERNGCTTNETC